MSSSKEAAPQKKQKDPIHFVNARPSSETEKLKIQRMVRAHVGKWISDQTRDRSTAPESSSSSSDSPQIPPELGNDSASRVLEEYEALLRSSRSTDAESAHSSPEAHTEAHSGSELVHSTRSLLRPGDQQPRNTHSKENDDPRTYNRSQALVVKSIDRTGSSTWDPFHTYPSHYSPEFITLQENYMVWPFLTPDSPSGSGVVANSTWFPLSLTDSTLFTAFLFSSLSHQYIRWFNRALPDGAFKPQDLRTLQMIEIETIKMVNEAVQDPTRAASDAVLLSVLCMAHNTTYSTQQRRPSDTPFTTPLQRLQWLDVYGSLPPNLVHIKGLIQMVLLRGGVNNIELPGLSSTLSFSDILTASAYLTRPVFPWIPLEKSRGGLTLQTLLGFKSVDIDHGFGRFRDIGFTPDMAEAFQAARVYTKIVEDYIGGIMAKPDLTLIVDQRNFVQSTILSLPPANQVSDLPRNHEIIYEACRLAALVYGVGIVFPLPSGGTPLGELGRLIQSVLQLPSAASVWNTPEAGVALIWILTLGGIAVENLPERTWFITALGHTARQNGISCWSRFRNALESLLWFDAACDQAGQRLWLEIERPFMSGN